LYQQIEGSKQKVPNEENSGKSEEFTTTTTTANVIPCKEEMYACERLIKYLLQITTPKKARKATNGKKEKPAPTSAPDNPEETHVEEPPKLNDDDPVAHHYTILLAFEKISTSVPKTVGQARDLIPVIKSRKAFFTYLVFPEKKTQKQKPGREPGCHRGRP